MTALTEFSYQGTGIRILGTKLEPWFVAVDVLKALGVHTKNISQVLKALDDDEKRVVNLAGEDVADCDIPDDSVVNVTTEPDELVVNFTTNSRGNPHVWIVSEPGLYRIIFRSDKPEARTFTRFVTHEVLPQIRKTGKYVPPQPERGRGRPALPIPTYEISTGEWMSLNGLRSMCLAFERPELNYESRFVKATAEDCVAYINAELAAGHRPRYDYDDDEKDEVYYINVDGKRVTIPA